MQKVCDAMKQKLIKAILNQQVFLPPERWQTKEELEKLTTKQLFNVFDSIF